MERIQSFKQRAYQIGIWQLLLLPFYPISVFITTPIRLLQLLWKSSILLEGKWEDYFHFGAHRALNDLFYWTHALNFWRYGRRGISPIMGTGNFPLSKLFFYSLPSLYAYWRLAPLVPFVGIFGWLFNHLLWTIVSPNDDWILLILFLCAISTSFYTQLYFQNYNSIGWMFFPIALFGLLNHQWWIASIGLFGASLSSITVTVIGSILFISYALPSLNIYPIIALIPASLVITSHFFPLLQNKKLKESLIMVTQAIGLTQKQAKYKRTRSLRLGLLELYYLALYLQFGLAYFFSTNTIPSLIITGIAIYITNTSIKRFADIQSMWFMMISVAAATMLDSPHLWLLPSFWLLISPLPYFCGIPQKKYAVHALPQIEPFHIKPWIETMEAFLQPIQSHQRVLMAFNDPIDTYENLFDGYRVLLELPCFIAAQREIHFLPTWAAVFEMNTPGAPDFWGRTPSEVEEKARFWKADYVIVYQDIPHFSIREWEEKGFTLISSLNWSPFKDTLQNARIYPESGIFFWHLFKVDEKLLK